jgi:hypothetical protein
MKKISIPVGQPLTFDALRQLNAGASAEELAEAFRHLPGELREQAWEQLVSALPQTPRSLCPNRRSSPRTRMGSSPQTSTPTARPTSPCR